MMRAIQMTRAVAAAVVVGAAALGSPVSAQVGSNPTDAVPTPFRTVENYFRLPAGRTWGAISAVEIDKDGRSIWIAERCGGNSDCLTKPTVDPILLFDQTGRLVRSFGAGLIASPHGIFVDADGNLWVTDYSDNAPRPARGAPPTTVGAAPATAGRAAGPAPGRGAAGPVGAAAGATLGQQVLKFSPEGTLLMALGTPGGARDPGFFYQPNDVLVAPNGDIFVAEGHGAGGRILRFDRTGRFLAQFGSAGSGPGQFNTPHALAMDSQGRLFVGDRQNNRVQVFRQDGTFLADWRQFGRPSGLYIDANDILYVADSESSESRNGATWKRGIRIGSVRDGRVTAFIPDPATMVPLPSTTAPEGVAADRAGNVYGGEVTERGMKRYVKN